MKERNDTFKDTGTWTDSNPPWALWEIKFDFHILKTMWSTKSHRSELQQFNHIFRSPNISRLTTTWGINHFYRQERINRRGLFRVWYRLARRETLKGAFTSERRQGKQFEKFPYENFMVTEVFQFRFEKFARGHSL